MNVKIIERPEMDAVYLVLWTESDGVRRAYHPEQGWVAVEPYEELPTWLKFEGREWDALMRALSPPVEGAADIIRRERALSDRLLGMVERAWDFEVRMRDS